MIILIKFLRNGILKLLIFNKLCAIIFFELIIMFLIQDKQYL